MDATQAYPRADRGDRGLLGGRGRGPAGRRALRPRAAPYSFPPRGCAGTAGAAPCAPVEVTGRGRIYSYTVNYQRWLPDLEVPYAIVLVEFPDHPGVRVVGRLRGCEPERHRDRRRGRSRIRARPGRLRHPQLRGDQRTSRPLMGTEHFEQRAVISGVGQSAIGRQVDRSGFQLTLDAVLAAVDDAGLTIDDIDGSGHVPRRWQGQPARIRQRQPVRGPGRPAASPPPGGRARSRA